MSRGRRHLARTPEDEVAIRAAFGSRVQVETYPPEPPIGEPDFSTPCGYPIRRPKELEGKVVRGFGREGPLDCNRPRLHDGDHMRLTDDFAVVARVPRWQDQRVR